MPVIGIDLGTQSLKAIVLDDRLNPLGAGAASYPVSYPQPGWAEQEPRNWLAALAPAISAALTQSSLNSGDINALAVCGQLDGCVATEGSGEPLGPAIIWMDRRAAPLLEGMDPDLVRSRAGLVLDSTHMAAKIAWLQREGAVGKVATWHQPVSFLVEALTGERAMARSLASTTMLLDLDRGHWSPDLLDLFEVTAEQLPNLSGDADTAGGLTRQGADLTGLREGTIVAVGTGDDFSNLLGSGIAAPGVVGVSLGTAEAVGALHREVLFDPDLLVETHSFPGGSFHLGNPGWLSGGALRWAARLLSLQDDKALASLAAGAEPGCRGLVFIPALSGAMTPKWISEGRGTFLGLTPHHGPAELARAVIEGTAFALRDIVDRLDELGVETGVLRLMGGGTRDPLLCQVRADVTGRPAEILADCDASAVGAGVLASVAVGLAPSIREASQALDLPVQRIEPSRLLGNRYDDAYGRYRAAFGALEPYWRAVKA